MILRGPHAVFDVKDGMIGGMYEEFVDDSGCWRCGIGAATVWAIGDDENEPVDSVRAALANEVCRIWCEQIWSPAWRSGSGDQAHRYALPVVQQETDELVALVKSFAGVRLIPAPHRASNHKPALYPPSVEMDEAAGIFHASSARHRNTSVAPPPENRADLLKLALEWVTKRRTLGMFSRPKR